MNHFESKLNEFSTALFQVNCWVLTGILLLLIIIFFLIRRSHEVRDWEINEAELGIGNQKLKLKINNDDAQIAYKIWVELSTRKIGIKIDSEKDVIEEVYNSWYQFFGVTRELIKNIPVSKMKRESTREIIELSICILNQGMRPHLTKWQAEFRKWYKQNSKNEPELSPQKIQRKFPQYDELMKDLTKVNEHMVNYCESMKKIALEHNHNSSQNRKAK